MKPELLLAIDVGTQSVRALVFDLGGQLLAKRQLPLEPAYHAPQPGWAEQPAEVYREAIAEACRQLWNHTPIRPADIAGLSLTTLRSTVVCAAEDGRPLRPAIVWLDQRRAAHPPAMGPLWHAGFRLAGAGDLLRHVQAESEANWLAENEPVLWQATDRFVFLSGWLSHWLTGDWVDSAGSQVGYVPFDYKHLRWAAGSDFKWRAFSIRPQQLPRLLPPGGRLGSLTAGAAAALGLRAGLPVIAAAADKACEVLGSGVIEPQTAQLSFGTSATINTLQPRYREVQRQLPAYPAAVPQHWLTEIQIYRGFWMVSWFKREFAHREAALAAERGVPVESLFDELLRSVPPGAMGLTLQPYWSPGVREPGPEAKGAVIGFGDVHTRAHFYRAILEGLAYGLRAGRDVIAQRLGHPLNRIIASGGGAQSDAVMQIAADVFGQPVERPATTETSGLGAAINLAVGLGLHADHAAAVQAMTRIGARFEPDPAAAKLYDALYREVYRPLYPRLAPLYRRIRRITGYPA
jgi:sugar (pentulose or hexulose) kinase